MKPKKSRPAKKSKTSKAPKNEKAPSDNGNNGRDKKTGRFLPGNPGGPGNPYAKQAHAFSNMLRSYMSQEGRFETLLENLFELVKQKNIHAIREIMDRLLGKASQQISATIDSKGRSLEDLRSLVFADMAHFLGEERAEELKKLGKL